MHPRSSGATVALVLALALGVAIVATFVPAIPPHARAPSQRSTTRPGNHGAESAVIRLSARLPASLLLGTRLAARRPRRLLLSVFSIAVTTSGLVAVLSLRAASAGWPAGPRVTQATTIISVVLIALAAVNAGVIAWTTALETRHSAALARALGATPRQITAGLCVAQLLPALVGALLGIPGGIAIYRGRRPAGRRRRPQRCGWRRSSSRLCSPSACSPPSPPDSPRADPSSRCSKRSPHEHAPARRLIAPPRISLTPDPDRGARVLCYPTVLDVPRELIVYVAGILQLERRRRGTRRGARLLSPFRQAVFVLAWFRDGGDVERLGAGFGLSRATAYRYRDEGIGALAEKAPDLVTVMAAAVRDGVPFPILDGKLVAIDRLDEKKTSVKGREIDAWYSGKSHDFRGNIQALIAPSGIPLWTSLVCPGSVHDITAAREHLLETVQHFLAEVPILADAGYIGAGAGVWVPVPNPRTAPSCPTTSALTTGCCADAIPRRTRLCTHDRPLEGAASCDHEPACHYRTGPVRSRPRPVRA